MLKRNFGNFFCKTILHFCLIISIILIIYCVTLFFSSDDRYCDKYNNFIVGIFQ